MEHNHWRTVRGRRYAYIRVRGVGRVSFPLSGCATDLEADARADLIARSVEQLVAVGAGGRSKALGTALGRAANPSALEEARARVARALEEARREAPAATVTVRAFAERWLSGELARLSPDHVKAIDQGDNRARFDLHVFPTIGGLPIADLDLDAGDRVMAELPPKLSSATRRQVAQCVYRLAHLAVYPGRVLARSPFPKGWLPAVGKPKAAPFLYPKEDAKLLGCVAIPLRHRVAYGLLAREGMRPGELVGRRGKRGRPDVPPMEWAAVDLENGTLALDRNKTGDARTWALDPATSRAIRRWRDEWQAEEVGPTEPRRRYIVGPLPGFAAQLRSDLLVAGVTRAELQERSETRTRMKGHHLRGTFVTLSLANGKTESWVQDRTGHTSTLMIQRYRRAARTAGELGLGPLLPLDEAIPELRG